MLRRLRYVSLAIVILFAWQTPGIQVLPGLDVLSPTYDGLRLAVSPLLRLMTVAAVVACLQQALSPDQWVSSFHLLAKPFACLGLPRDRLAIRLRLVLDYLEAPRLEWRDCLRAQDVREEDKRAIGCQLERAGIQDFLWIGLMCLAAIGIWLW